MNLPRDFWHFSLQTLGSSQATPGQRPVQTQLIAAICRVSTMFSGKLIGRVRQAAMKATRTQLPPPLGTLDDVGFIGHGSVHQLPCITLSRRRPIPIQGAHSSKKRATQTPKLSIGDRYLSRVPTVQRREQHRLPSCPSRQQAHVATTPTISPMSLSIRIANTTLACSLMRGVALMQTCSHMQTSQGSSHKHRSFPSPCSLPLLMLLSLPHSPAMSIMQHDDKNTTPSNTGTCSGKFIRPTDAVSSTWNTQATVCRFSFSCQHK